jgi:hypothetical protein
LQNGLYNQTVDRDLGDISMQMCNNAKDSALCCCQTQKAILEAQYNSSLGFKDVQLQICNQTNELKSAILEDGQRTREILVANQIQDLRDRLTDAKTTISNYDQNQYLLNTLGNWYSRPSVNPCYLL